LQRRRERRNAEIKAERNEENARGKGQKKLTEERQK
jgi:hypothetical protein